MSKPHPHPNDPGRWNVLEQSDRATLWRRDRSDPFPLTMFYVVSPPLQPELIYVEQDALRRFSDLEQSTAA